MRRIVQVPIIHTAADVGSLSGLVQARYAKVGAVGVTELRAIKRCQTTARDAGQGCLSWEPGVS